MINLRHTKNCAKFFGPLHRTGKQYQFSN